MARMRNNGRNNWRNNKFRDKKDDYNDNPKSEKDEKNKKPEFEFETKINTVELDKEGKRIEPEKDVTSILQLMGSNYGIKGVIGSDIEALKMILPTGWASSYPSLPTPVQTSTLKFDLGGIRIGDRLLQARNRGTERQDEIAVISHKLKYTYSGILTVDNTDDLKDKIKLYFDSAEADKVFMLYDYTRAHYNRTSINAALNAFNNSANRTSQWNNYVFAQKQTAYYTTADKKEISKTVTKFAEDKWKSQLRAYVANGGTFSDKEDTPTAPATQYGTFSWTTQEIGLITMQMAMLSAASFNLQWESVKKLIDALATKYPYIEHRIAEVVGSMYKSRFTNVLKQIKSVLHKNGFDFDEWQNILKPMNIASSRNHGSDDLLLITEIAYIKPEPFYMGTPSVSDPSEVNPLTLKFYDTDKLINNTNVWSRIVEWLFSDKPAREGVALLMSIISPWIGWADLFNRTFNDEAIIFEFATIGAKMPSSWSTGFQVDYSNSAAWTFSNFQLSYNILESSAMGGAEWNYETDSYVLKLPIYRIQDGFMAQTLSNQGYYMNWIEQANILKTRTKTSSMALSRMMSYSLNLYTYKAEGGVDINTPKSLVYDATAKAYIWTVKTGKSDLDGTLFDWHSMSDTLPFLPEVLIKALYGDNDTHDNKSIMSKLHKSTVITTIEGYADNIVVHKDNYERTKSIFPFSSIKS